MSQFIEDSAIKKEKKKRLRDDQMGNDLLEWDDGTQRGTVLDKIC